ncbi:heavy-metal-associated domain-containing protein [Chitinimonas sp. PSY-7]|uniref:cation transporter n=1 Tax=Chitinimonas sp. PSY-7 TaxID=3459088 RepID=UPI00403FFA9C
MEHVFLIEGMTCGGCVAAVEKALKAHPGVQQVTASLADKCAKVDFDPVRTDVATLRAAIEVAGFDVTS